MTKISLETQVGITSQIYMYKWQYTDPGGGVRCLGGVSFPC
jgi:hypothetical protein